MRRKKWEVLSLVTLSFSVNDRILREIWESQTSVISVLDLALADRAIYRARVLKTYKGRHKTRAIKAIWSFIHILKRMWGLPVLEPAIWSRDTGERIPCFDRCQVTITGMSKIKEVRFKPRVCVWPICWNMAAVLRDSAPTSTTSFPGSLFSASLGRWKKDPGCGWSHDNLWH